MALPRESRDTRAFHDELADRYDLLYADRDAGIARQGRALNALLTASARAPVRAAKAAGFHRPVLGARRSG
ncbi:MULTISPECIES: hypothetical protein [unclassified Streptomyces]|uniref:hypothetical protein n=1 Tax=unclassified Streptomyces TaxID=2593676 RepID=UPI002E0F2D5D|nr:hypothetical protein OG299_29075 [Streptomyces sp. NBC_01296]WSW59125.1 hypothetical protein OG513_11370 [Streptomyces sp. NBC_00998]